MKILIAALDQTYNFIVPLLEADGHEVRLLTHCEGIPLMFGTPEAKAHVSQQITEFEPDLVINAVPSIVLPTSSDYTYLGNNWISAKLETHKWETRKKAAELGWKLPVVLEECDMDTMSTYDRTVYLKPKGLNPWNQAWRIPPNTAYNSDFPSGFPAFVEDSVDYAVEAFCFFTISNGSYSVTRMLGCSGYGHDKTMTSDSDWKVGKGDLTHFELTDAQAAAWLPKCTAWLDYIVTLGGTYEGSIGGLIDSDNEVYWMEQNSRPFTYNNGSIPGSIQDWIDSLTTDPNKSVNPNHYITI